MFGPRSSAEPEPPAPSPVLYSRSPDSEAVLDLFRRSGALLEGHFRLTSGLHSERYLQSALVLQYPELAEALGAELAERTRHLQPTAVLSPALGGIVIGQEVARALGGAGAVRGAAGRGADAAARLHAVGCRSRRWSSRTC